MGQIDYAKLAAEHGGTAQAAGGVDYAALAAEHGGAAAEPDFKTSNQKDAAGNATIDPNTVGTLVRHLWDGILGGTVGLGQLLPFPKSLGGSGTDHPLALNPDQQYAPNFLTQMHDVKKEADQLWEKGEHAKAAAKYVESVVPIFGPMMSHWGSELDRGQYAAAAGDMAGFALTAASSAALPGVKSARGGISEPIAVGVERPATLAAAGARPAGMLTPEEQAANAFAESRGIPLDAATATGSPFVRGVQKVSGESLLGSIPASRGRAAQAAGLERVGGELATDVHPSAVSPEGAGAGVVSKIRDLMSNLRKQAGEAYGRVEEAQRTAAPDYVAKAEDGATIKARETRQHASIGYVPEPKVIAELHGILDEMENLPYQAPSWTDVTQEAGLNRGNAGGGKFVRTSGAGGAEVFNDIREMSPSKGTENATRGEVIADIRSALETGHYKNTAKGALAVAERRAAGDFSIISQPVPFRRMTGKAAGVEPMQLAVDLSDVRSALKPIHERLMQENNVAPLQGGKAEALRTLDRVLNGPAHVPLTTAEAALSDLKSVARQSDPLLRSAGEGIAAKAVRELQATVEMRAAAAGDDVLGALREGRAATKAKYDAAQVLRKIAGKAGDRDPVKIYQSLTANRDTAINQLRAVQELAPDLMPEIGRAKLQEWLDLATERGRFDHADRLYAEWNKLGPETKRILFGKENVSNLDNFFLVAKRIGENPNPSGTAPTLVKAGEVGGLVTHPIDTIAVSATMGGLAKLLYSPKGVKALTRLLESDPATAARAAAGKVSKPIGRAASQAAWLDVAAAAKQAGVDVPMPKAADLHNQR